MTSNQHSHPQYYTSAVLMLDFALCYCKVVEHSALPLGETQTGKLS